MWHILNLNFIKYFCSLTTIYCYTYLLRIIAYKGNVYKLALHCKTIY